VTFIERRSRYWIVTKVGLKTTELFAKATKTVWQSAKASQYIRWFTDGERRYAQQLWQKASVYLKSTEVSREYGHRKVWRHGLEVAIKVQRLVHNWVRPHVGLGKNKTPAMAIGLYHRPLSIILALPIFRMIMNHLI